MINTTHVTDTAKGRAPAAEVTGVEVPDCREIGSILDGTAKTEVSKEADRRCE